MTWLRAAWCAFKEGFAAKLEGAVGMPWPEAIRVLRRSVLPALWERFVGLVVFLGSLSIGVLVLWVAWRVFVLLRKVAVPVLLLICAGCEVDGSGLRSDPCATCDGWEVNKIVDAKVVVLCLGLAACASESTPATDGSLVPGKGPSDFDGGAEILQIDADLLEAVDAERDTTVPADSAAADTGLVDTQTMVDVGRVDARPFPVRECADAGGGIGNPCGRGYLDSDWSCIQSTGSVVWAPCSFTYMHRLYVDDCSECALYGEVRP